MDLVQRHLQSVAQVIRSGDQKHVQQECQREQNKPVHNVSICGVYKITLTWRREVYASTCAETANLERWTKLQHHITRHI
jgi:hypothetical protein